MEDRRHVPPHPTPEQARVQRTLRERARELRLHVGFGQGRRATDVTLVVVKGDRFAVLRALPTLFAGLALDEPPRHPRIPTCISGIYLLAYRSRTRPADGLRDSGEGGDEMVLNVQRQARIDVRCPGLSAPAVATNAAGTTT